MRASNADREEVVQALQDAAAQNRITMDELSERLTAAYAAKTFGELEPITADLPVSGRPQFAPSTAGSSHPPARITPDPHATAASIGILGGTDRGGSWSIAPTHTAVAVMGGINLDLRDVSFSAPETVIRATAVMGGVDIKVPPDVTVRVRGFGFMGGFVGRDQEGPPGAPVVVVKGFAFWGGVNVSRKARPELET